METKKKGSGAANFFSGVYLLLALCLLIGVCARCYPDLEQKAKQAIAGAADGPVQEAFSVLVEGFGESEPVKEVVSRSFEVLTGGET